MASRTMPAVDWLTGLASREAFARQVTQAERDRDRFAVAVIKIRDFATLNGQLDYDAGDELLRLMGRALSQRVSVNATAGRLGGAEFGLLAVDLEPGEATRLVSPVAAELRTTITEWTTQQAADTGTRVIEPGLAIGVASGFSERVWAEAGLAADLAGDGVDDPVVEYVSDDPRISAAEQRRSLDRDIVSAMSSGRLRAAGRRVEVPGLERSDWTWLRLGAAIDDEATPVETADLETTTGRRVERWLADEAGAIIAGASGQLRLTVSISHEIGHGRALSRTLFPIIERHRIPPSRLVFEIEEAVVAAEPTRAGRLISRLVDIGAGVALTGSDGGWTTWEVAAAAPVSYLQPRAALVERAALHDPLATRVLASLAACAEERDIELIAPPSTAGDELVAGLGFTYVERAGWDRHSIDVNRHRDLGRAR